MTACHLASRRTGCLASLLITLAGTAHGGDALPPLFGSGKGAHVEQTGTKPSISVADTDHDGVYDQATTTSSSISAHVAAQCDDDEAVAPAGTIGISGGGEAWTGSYFTFQAEPWHQQPLLAVAAPDNHAQPDFPAEYLDEALARCNALAAGEKSAGAVLDAQIGVLGYGVACVEAPGVTVTPTGEGAALFAKNLFTLGLYTAFNPLTFGAEGSGLVADTPLGVSVHCQPAEPLMVESSGLATLESATLGGHCAVTLSGTIHTNHPNQPVSFRYVDDDGHQSNVHQVVTDHAGVAAFHHQYDIPADADGPESGQIRMVGVQPSFQSAWSGYAMDCLAASPSGVVAQLPPSLELHVEPVDNTMIGGQICPTRVRLVAGVDAPSGFVGSLIFVGSEYFSGLHPVQLGSGQKKQYGDYRDLHWGVPGGFGSALSSGQGADDALRSQPFTMGYNLVDGEGQVAWQYPRQGFSVTCRRPQVNPGVGAVGGLASAVHVHQAVLAAAPEATLDGGQCGVRLNGNLRANLAHARLTFDIRDQRGQTLRSHVVTTDAQKEAHFADYIDFTRPAEGVWIDDSGKISLDGIAQGGTRSGHFRVVGTNVAFQSNIAAYHVHCHDKAPGGLVATPKKPKPTVPTVGTMTASPRPDPAAPSNTPTSTPRAASLSAGTAPRGDAEPTPTTPRVMGLSASVAKRPDAAVEAVRLQLRRGIATVRTTIANHGSADAGGNVLIRLKSADGATVQQFQQGYALAPGRTQTIEKRFRARGQRSLLAQVVVRGAGDANPANNERSARAK